MGSPVSITWCITASSVFGYPGVTKVPPEYSSSARMPRYSASGLPISRS
ncbi:hypothetical protein SCYAM73S_04880 [Streptomyces cyaneofuscatus]